MRLILVHVHCSILSFFRLEQTYNLFEFHSQLEDQTLDLKNASMSRAADSVDAEIDSADFGNEVENQTHNLVEDVDGSGDDEVERACNSNRSGSGHDATLSTVSSVDSLDANTSNKSGQTEQNIQSVFTSTRSQSDARDANHW